jgi:hypothetical protein
VGTLSLGSPEVSATKLSRMGCARLHSRSGPALTMSNSANAAKDTTPRCGHWPSNGSVSHSVAGKTGSPMTRACTWQRSPDAPLCRVALRSLFLQRKPVKFLWRFRGKLVRRDEQVVDRATQMSACHAGGRGFESRRSCHLLLAEAKNLSQFLS